jgi:dUTP pyrophosphatase
MGSPDIHLSQWEKKPTIYCEILDNGKMPVRAHASDAGIDFFATEDIEIYPGQVIKHPLNVKVQLPKGTYLELTSKSGLGVKGLLIFAGIIDESYRGVIHAVMTMVKNDNNTPLVIKKGSKICQGIMHAFHTNYVFIQVDKISEDTDRSGGGFGSSGQ